MKFKKLALFTLLTLFVSNQCQASALENLLTTPTGISILATSCASFLSLIASTSTSHNLLDNRALRCHLQSWNIPRAQLRLINPKLETSRSSASCNKDQLAIEQALTDQILSKNNQQENIFRGIKNKHLSTCHNSAVFLSTISCAASIYLAQKNKFAHATPAFGFYSGMSIVASIFSLITANAVNNRVEHIMKDGTDAFLKKYPQVSTANTAQDAAVQADA